VPDASPYASLSRHQAARTSDKRALLALSRSIEARALAGAPHADLWVSLQHVRFHAGRTRRLHVELARAGVRVHVYGVRVRDGRPVPDALSCHDISEFGPLAQEWDVLLVTPELGLGLAARQVEPLLPGHHSDDMTRRFDWVLSEDRADVAYAAAALPGETFVLGRDFGTRRPA
jgi:hypothetical protein